MNKTDGPDIEELLSCYIDGQLSERASTEIKRLIRHDKHVADKLRQLQRQKQLLNSLPVAAAPQGLLDKIKADTERLKVQPVERPEAAFQRSDEYAGRFEEPAGVRGLFYRKVLTAAVLVIFLGVFGWVISTIITPAPAIKPTAAIINGPKTSAQDTLPKVSKASDEQPSVMIPFNAGLQLSTRQLIEVNEFLGKAIYSHGLLDYTIKRQQENQTSYHISCSPEAIIALVGDIGKAWDRFETASLTVLGQTAEVRTEVDNITADQVVAILKESDSNERIKIAGDFAGANALIENTAAAEGQTPPVLPVPIEPILTRPEPPKKVEPLEPGETATLTITVIGL